MNSLQPQLLEYQFSPAVRAFSTTRKGGVGEGAYSEFNITHYCGDSAEHVAQNRQLLCNELGINDHQLFLPRQIHGNDILLLDDAFLKKGETERSAELEGKDAVVTAIPGICIGVSTADCVPVLVYDEKCKVSAAIHAGWRGTVSKIVGETIRFMETHCGCSAVNMKAVIGPSISLAAFEVGVEVYQKFLDAGFPMDSISRFYPHTSGDTKHEGVVGKWHLDLWAANWLLLEEAGVPFENIQVANVCTYATSDSFFSARQLGIQSGRIYTGIIIK